MKQTWRWFGPHDLATIADIRQAGATGVVSGLHQIANGEVWSPAEIAKRQREIAVHPDGAPSGVAWAVVESLPVSEDIKKQKGDFRAHYAAYRQSLENLAGAGIKTVCYNFMPVLDWTRTELAWRLPNGARAMRFDLIDFAAFDIHLLARPGAAGDYPEPVCGAAKKRHAAMREDDKSRLIRNIVAGLPGANEHLTLDDVRRHLAEYDAISPETLRAHFVDFLAEVVPTAERAGVRLCCHPDDPPFALMGLPRVASTGADYDHLLSAIDSPNSGITFCTGSLGVRPDNDLVAMIRHFGPKIHFVHLRNIRRAADDVPTSFFESGHLDGDVDMVAVIEALIAEERRRKTEGRPDWEMPMRPDHGQDIIDDLTRNGQPGYPIVGRLKGLAELRGVMQAIEARPA